MSMSGDSADSLPDRPWLDGGGETGALIRAFDWSRTALGALGDWPQSLRTATELLLRSPVPIVLLWGEQGYMIYNDAYSLFAGERHPALLGSEVREGWSEVAEFNDNVMRVGLAGGTLAYKDQQLTLQRHGRPEPVWMNLDYSPVLDESGKPAGVIAIVVETTERVRAEQSIRANEARLRFLDTLRESTARYTDADTLLATTTRMLGKHLGVSICAYADMDDDENAFTIRGGWAAPGSHSIVGRYKLTDFGGRAVTQLSAGEAFVLNDRDAELPADEAEAFGGLGAAATVCMPLIRGGRLTALMAIHQREPRVWQPDDLALLTEVVERSWAHIERVRAEAAVRESERRFRESLEEKVRERTAALMQAEKALMQAQKMEALGNLTGGIAHDFNNLLMAVQGSLELLRERIPSDPLLLRLVDHAYRGAERGAVLTRRMLAFARRQDLASERVDVRHLVEGMTELMQRALGSTVIVETRFGAQPAVVEADVNQLESALLNLAVNARDAMDGVGTITIATDDVQVPPGDATLAAGRYVRLSMTDSGSGMSEATLKRATEPFFTTKGVGKGTGLGLSMVHGLAEQLGGTLVLSSRPDIGTTAEVWLPAVDAQVRSATPDPATTPAPLATATSPDEAWVILAVDDDDLVRATTVEMLETMGYHVLQARSGAEALRLLEHTTVHLVVTDHAMPQMTGTQLAQRVRDRDPTLPVVLVTGYADIAGGADDDLPRLAKPFTYAALTETVARALPRH
jgi:signal transduction histidine kinase/CheY-like chemotaxis protein